MTENSNLRAIAYALGSFTLWVVADTLIKVAAGNETVPANEIVGFAGLFGAFGIAGKSGWQTGFTSLRLKNWHAQWPRVLFVLGNSFANVVALKHLTLVMFYIIIFTSPLLIAVLAALIFNEKMGMRQWIAIIIGFFGVIVALNPVGIAVGNDWIGVAGGVASVICFSANTLWLRITTRTETVDSLLFFVNVAIAIAGFSLLPWVAVPLHLTTFFLLAAMGLISFGGDLGNMLALKYSPAATVEQYHYTQIITGALLGFVIWGDALRWPVLAGAALITSAGLYIAMQAKTNS